jgi:hypothetical protein
MAGHDRWLAREEIRKRYPDPTPEAIAEPEFQAILDLVDDWRVEATFVEHYIPDGAYNFIRAVLDAIAQVREGTYKPVVHNDEDGLWASTVEAWKKT